MFWFKLGIDAQVSVRCLICMGFLYLVHFWLVSKLKEWRNKQKYYEKSLTGQEIKSVTLLFLALPLSFLF